MITHLIYDGSFHGLLTGIFEIYERKLSDAEIIRSHHYQPHLNGSMLTIETDRTKSGRVWNGLRQKISASKRNEVFKTFLSELPEMERVITQFSKHVFSNDHNVEEDLGHPGVLGVKKIAKKVHREKHRMEAFIRFQRTKDDLYFASIEPDFNVLPLIASHFRDRYADQRWLIYDLRRKYGISYDCQTSIVTEVTVDFDRTAMMQFLPESMCHEDEMEYQKLWKDYFCSVNIGARKNVKLHVRHVPTRYWRYLTEKRIT
ncbi:MAG: TIGR03915 family putative DNA repair protein [Chryseolinea sp.]